MQADEEAALQQQQQAEHLKVLQDHNSRLKEQLAVLKSNLADAAGKQEEVGSQRQMPTVLNAAAY